VFWFNKQKINSGSRVFIEHEIRLGHLSRRDRSLEETASTDPAVVEFAGQSLGLTIPASRLRLGWFLLFFFLVFFSGRAVYLQVFQGTNYRAMAEENRFQIQYLPAERGVVTDVNGQILSENVSVFTLTMTIADLPEKTNDRDVVFDRVAGLTGLQRADLDLLLQEYIEVPEEEVIVEKDLDYEHALLAMIETKNLPGFAVRTANKRRYASSSTSLSHVLGYVSKINADEFEELKNSGYRRTDEIGKAGVEVSWEIALRGKHGRRLVEVDASGNETAIFSEELPIQGSAITLSIDYDLQIAAEQYLVEKLKELGKKRASLIITNPNNGEILAMVSLPTYDSNLFAGGIDRETYTALIEDPNQPLFPRAVFGEFPSGSTFKPYVAAAALAEGIISPSTSFLSTGGLAIGQWFFPDWKAGGHGVTDVRKALAESVNTFFYIIGGGYETFTGLGVEKITSYASLFGFGQKTGIDLPNEANGFLPSKEWKEEAKGERWYVGDTYHLAIGQGDLLVTPIQMANALSTIANGGTKFAPRVVHAVAGQEVTSLNTELSDPLKEAIKIVQQGMRQSVTSGSSRRLNSLPITSAGKTGTAQIGGTEETHAWFTGFAPYENPEITVTILIEESGVGPLGEGSTTAVPVAEKIFRWWSENR